MAVQYFIDRNRDPEILNTLRLRGFKNITDVQTLELEAARSLNKSRVRAVTIRKTSCDERKSNVAETTKRIRILKNRFRIENSLACSHCSRRSHFLRDCRVRLLTRCPVNGLQYPEYIHVLGLPFLSWSTAPRWST